MMALFVRTFSRELLHRPFLRVNILWYNITDRPNYNLDDSNRTSSKEHHAACSLIHRAFHTTAPREIVPFIGAAAVLITIRYSYKAWQRMDDEWADYEWELQQYERAQMQAHPSTTNARTVGIDIGTLFGKLALSYPQPEVVVTRQGDRAFCNGILYGDAKNVEARGRQALDKLWYAPILSSSEHTNDYALNEPVHAITLPWNVLSTDDASVDRQRQVLHDAFAEVLQEALDRMQVNEQEHALRLVATLPFPAASALSSSDILNNLLATASGTYETALVPDPVATIWGAQQQLIMPHDEEHRLHKTMIVDVGAQVTQVSIVQKSIVHYCCVLPWGGERILQVAMALILQHGNDNMATSLSDERALQAIQVQTRAALYELSGNHRPSSKKGSPPSQAHVHVPYVFPDPQNHHLDTTLSRSVLEQAVQDDIRHRAAAQMAALGVLSRNVPAATDLSSLLLSSITQCLEQAMELPAGLDYILLVGGASKTPWIRSALEQAVYTLMGSDGARKLVVPDSSAKSELCVLGAAAMLPKYHYSIEDGLQRGR